MPARRRKVPAREFDICTTESPTDNSKRRFQNPFLYRVNEMQVMDPENCQSVPPLLPPALAPPKPQRAPTLYFIIAFKLLKGALLLLAAFVVYNMAGLDLQQEFARMIQQANL